MARRLLISCVIIFTLLTFCGLFLTGCGSSGGSKGASLNQSGSNSGNPSVTPNPHIAVSDTGIRYLYGVSKTKKDGNVFFYLRTARTYQEAVLHGQPQANITIYLWGNYRTHVITDSEGKFSLMDFVGKRNTRAALVRFAAFNKDGTPLGSFEDILAYFGPGNPETLQRIEIIPSDLTLNVGDSCTFFCYGYDEDDYPIWIFYPQWSSSNNSTGVIDSMFGTFSALASGSTTITASFQNLTDTATISVQGSSSASGSLTGTVYIVNTTTSLPEALVMVMPANPWAFFLGGTAYSDSNGDFSISDIPNGDYYIYAFAFYDGDPYMSNMTPQTITIEGSTEYDIGCASPESPPPSSEPIINNLYPNNGPVDTTVTVNGNNFGSTQGSSIVTFYDEEEAQISLWSNTLIICQVPEDAETGPVIVHVGEDDSNDDITFSVTTGTPPPHIDSLNPTSGHVSDPVTITGTYFGSTQGESTLTFNGTSATSSSWSNTQIVCTVPEGAASGSVVVTVGEQASNYDKIYTVITIPQPHIDYLNPTSGHIGDPVTIIGTNFGTTQGGSTVIFDTASATVTSWSDTQIICDIPTAATTGPVQITVSGQNSNNDKTLTVFTAPQPYISNLNPATGYAGDPVTISGEYFGTTQGGSTVAFNGTVAGVTGWNDTQILCTVPSGATTGNIIVTVGGQASSGINFTVTIPAPHIGSLSLYSGYPGDTITINGSDFGTSGTVTFNSTSASVASWTDTRIICTVPSAATSGDVVVTNAVDSSDGVTFTVNYLPHIDSLSPTSGHIGDPVTIAGTYFGASQSGSTITFNGTIVESYSQWSDTQLICLIPDEATTGPVVVTINGPNNGHNSNNDKTFTITEPPVYPVIAYLNQTQGWPGLKLTIYGQHFGTVQGSSLVEFNTTTVTEYLSWNDSRIVIRIPNGISGLHPSVSVTVNDLESNSDITFAIVAPPLPPSLDAVYPNSGPIGTCVTIYGNNFGVLQIDDSSIFFDEIDAGTATFWSSTEIICTVPETATTGPITIRIKGQYSNDDKIFTVTPVPPYIENISPFQGPVNTTVTITGSNFTTSTQGRLVTFDDKTSGGSWTDTRIICTVPYDLNTGLAEVVVHVGGQDSNSKVFNVTESSLTPSIYYLNPNSGIIGDNITIEGENFGSSGGVKFNGTSATPTLWSDTRIICPIPTGATSGDVIVTVASLESNGENCYVITGSSYAIIEGQITHYDTQANLAEVKIEFEVISGGNVGEKYRVLTSSAESGFNYQIHIPSSPAVMRLTLGKETFYNDIWTTGYLNTSQVKILNTDMVPNDIEHTPPYPHNSWGP